MIKIRNDDDASQKSRKELVLVCRMFKNLHARNIASQRDNKSPLLAICYPTCIHPIQLCPLTLKNQFRSCSQGNCSSSPTLGSEIHNATQFNRITANINASYIGCDRRYCRYVSSEASTLLTFFRPSIALLFR